MSIKPSNWTEAAVRVLVEVGKGGCRVLEERGGPADLLLLRRHSER